MRQRFIPLFALVFLLTSPGCAADRHLKRGHAALAVGDAPTAQHHFERALRHRDKLADDAAFRETLRVATRDAELTRGRAAMDRQQWATAADHFDAALAQDPGFPAALQARARAGHLAAPALYDAALKRADLDDLPAARRFLTDALRLDPDHPAAAKALASLDDPFPFTRHERAATQQASEQNWAAAVDAWDQAIHETPNRLPARAALHRTRGDAADHFVSRGRDGLERGRPDEAERAFRAALLYRPGDHRVTVGLRDADVKRGDQALATEQPGAAYLAYRRAARLDPDSAVILQALDTAADKLRDAHAGLVMIDAAQTHPDPELNAHQQTLLGLTRDQIAAAADGWVFSGNALGIDADAPPDIDVALAHLQVTRPAPTAQAKRQAYDVEFAVPNPRLPGLRVELHRIQDCIAQYAHDEDSLRHQLARARRHGDVHRCDQLERRLRRVRRQLDDARNQRRAVSHAIHAEPHEIIKTRTEHWPYTLEHHEQTGRITGHWSPHGEPNRTFAGDYHETDEVVLDANPQVGLAADPLELEPTAAAEQALIVRAARELADAIATDQRRRHARALTGRAQALADRDPAAATEAEIAALFAAASPPPRDAAARLDDLTQTLFPTLAPAQP